ncbi:MAG TPA: hypothetical protein VNM90_21690, partial [Haliangium sp.]|nr:hypothetical protein [Haliangium sp.]
MKARSPMNRLVLACCLLALVGGSSCGKNRKNTHPTRIAPTTDALWALAPAGTKLGVVVAPGTGPLLAAAWAVWERSASRFPTLLQAPLTELRGAAPAELFDAGARARMGLDIERGAALFMVSQDEFALVLPVVDRAAFRQRVGGAEQEVDGVAVDVDVMGDFRCRDIAEHYVCAISDAALAAVGNSDALARRIAERPAGLRGAIEIEVGIDILDQAERANIAETFPGLTVARAAVQLAPGVLTARMYVDGKVASVDAGAMLQVPDTLARRAAEKRPGGFFRLTQPGLGEQAAALMSLAGMSLGLEIDTGPLAELTGEVVAASAAGDVLDFSVQLGARNGKRLQPLVNQLCQAAQDAGLPVPVKMESERCMLRVEPLLLTLAGVPPELGLERPLELALGTSDTALVLHLTLGGQTSTAGSEMSPLGRELLTERWAFALWGRGTVLRKMQSAPFMHPGAMLHALPSEDKETVEAARATLWLLAHLAEVGWGLALRQDGTHAVLHLGTHWANPDEVVRAYEALLDRMLAGGAGGDGGDVQADFAALAQKHPRTLLGQAYESGPGGLITVALASGTLSAVAIPAFMQYMENARGGESQ